MCRTQSKCTREAYEQVAQTQNPEKVKEILLIKFCKSLRQDNQMKGIGIVRN